MALCKYVLSCIALDPTFPVGMCVHLVETSQASLDDCWEAFNAWLDLQPPEMCADSCR